MAKRVPYEVAECDPQKLGIGGDLDVPSACHANPVEICVGATGLGLRHLARQGEEIHRRHGSIDPRGTPQEGLDAPEGLIELAPGSPNEIELALRVRSVLHDPFQHDLCRVEWTSDLVRDPGDAFVESTVADGCRMPQGSGCEPVGVPCLGDG
jgi:hypothetical protein